MQKLSKNELENTYGGNMWMLLLPFMFQALYSTVSSIRMFSSDSGSFSYNGMKSEWKSNSKTKNSSSKKMTKLVYAY